MATAHAVGVQKIRPVNTEVTRSHCSEKANDIYMKMYILTGSRCSQRPPGTRRDGTEVFQSRRSQRAEQRDIAALGGIHMALLHISTYSAPNECVCVCEVSSGSRSCRLWVFWEPSTSGSKPGAETTLTALNTRTVWWQTNSTCAQQHTLHTHNYCILQQTHCPHCGETGKSSKLWNNSDWNKCKSTLIWCILKCFFNTKEDHLYWILIFLYYLVQLILFCSGFNY